MDANLIKIRLKKATGKTYEVVIWDAQLPSLSAYCCFNLEFKVAFDRAKATGYTEQCIQVCDYIINKKLEFVKNRSGISRTILAEPLTEMEKVLYAD